MRTSCGPNHLGYVDPFEASDVCALRGIAERHPQQRRLAYPAEEVARLAGAQDVAREMFPRSQYAELLALDAPMEKSAPRADRAVALHGAGQLAVDHEGKRAIGRDQTTSTSRRPSKLAVDAVF